MDIWLDIFLDDWRLHSVDIFNQLNISLCWFFIEYNIFDSKFFLQIGDFTGWIFSINWIFHSVNFWLSIYLTQFFWQIGDFKGWIFWAIRYLTLSMRHRYHVASLSMRRWYQYGVVNDAALVSMRWYWYDVGFDMGLLLIQLWYWYGTGINAALVWMRWYWYDVGINTALVSIRRWYWCGVGIDVVHPSY